MDSESEELYFQKIQEFIQDDDKIVTIPFLAKALEISIQDSKHLIEKYVRDQYKLQEKLGVTCILTGNLKDGNQKVVMMIKDTDLEEKSQMFSEIHGKVIFSVQKNTNVDFSTIALVDQLRSTNLKEKPLAGSIVGKNCTKRVLNFKKLPTLPTPTIKGKSSFFIPNEETSKSSEKQNEIRKSDNLSKSNGIANLFNKISSKETEKKITKETKPVAKPKGGLSSFLSKSSVKTSSNSDNGHKDHTDKENVMKVSSSNEFDSQGSIKIGDLTSFVEVEEESQDPAEMVEVVMQSPKKNKIKEAKVVKSKDKNKSQKRQRDQSEGKSTKRRKRIVVRDDSDSDDLFEKEEENQDVIEKSDEEPERIPSPVTKKPLPPKNKKRKAIDKTYVDDEGFVVTQTEYVYETASEEEKEEEIIKKEEEKQEKSKLVEKKSSASSENDNSPKMGLKGKKGKKNAAPQNQPTLMNFFKKK